MVLTDCKHFFSPFTTTGGSFDATMLLFHIAMNFNLVTMLVPAN
jgi:hypothetical protein